MVPLSILLISFVAFAPHWKAVASSGVLALWSYLCLWLPPLCPHHISLSPPGQYNSSQYTNTVHQVAQFFCFDFPLALLKRYETLLKMPQKYFRIRGILCICCTNCICWTNCICETSIHVADLLGAYLWWLTPQPRTNGRAPPNIEYILVIKHRWYWWLPPSLLLTRPMSFNIVDWILVLCLYFFVRNDSRSNSIVSYLFKTNL